MGRGVARKLGLAPGASLSLFALSKGGGVNTQSYVISGTTATIIAALDNVSVFMDLGDAQSLIGGDAVPQLIVFLKNTADSARVAQILRGTPAARRSPVSPSAVGGALTYYRQANSAYQLVLAVARLIVLIVALFSISGTLSLAVMERLREARFWRTDLAPTTANWPSERNVLVAFLSLVRRPP